MRFSVLRWLKDKAFENLCETIFFRSWHGHNIFLESHKNDETFGDNNIFKVLFDCVKVLLLGLINLSLWFFFISDKLAIIAQIP